jgi:hypothetical protein
VQGLDAAGASATQITRSFALNLGARRRLGQYDDVGVLYDYGGVVMDGVVDPWVAPWAELGPFDGGGGGGGGGGDMLGQDTALMLDGTEAIPIVDSAGDVVGFYSVNWADGTTSEFNPYGVLVSVSQPATADTMDPNAATGVTTEQGTPINWGAILNGTVAILTAGTKLYGAVTGTGAGQVQVPAGYRASTTPGVYVGPDGRSYRLNAQGQPVLATTTAATGGLGGLGMLALLGGGLFLLMRK